MLKTQLSVFGGFYDWAEEVRALSDQDLLKRVGEPQNLLSQAQERGGSREFVLNVPNLLDLLSSMDLGQYTYWPFRRECNCTCT